MNIVKDFAAFRTSWFDKKYMYKLGGRYATFRVAFNLLAQMPNHIIVETGCQRMLEDWGAGCSTLLFADFIDHYGGHLTTIDISSFNMEVAKSVSEFAKDKITYVIENSLTSLSKMNPPMSIDLLYLDSMDCPADNSDASESQEHNLAELLSVEQLLHPGSIVMLDDQDFVNGGKPLLTNDYMLNSGQYTLLMHCQQSLWIKK